MSSTPKPPAWLESLLFHAVRDLRDKKATPEEMEATMVALFKALQEKGELLQK